METEVSNVGSSTKVLIGSTVMTMLGVFLGSVIIILGSLLKWRNDAVLGLYNQSGWSFENLISGDGKITFGLGVFITVAMIIGLVTQNKTPYMLAVIAGLAVFALSLYDWVYIGTSPGITGPGHGLYMVFFGSIGCLLTALGGYLMMAEGTQGPVGEPLKD